ncbi:MAG: sodium/proline symporter [Planctomycetota bacterium]|jgi:sodium/proline symporter
MDTVTISFIVYTLLIVGVGVYASRFASDSDEDFFLAGRSIGPWMAALSSCASGSSGWVTIGLVGLGFASGAIAYWLIPGVLVGIAFNWFVIAGPMRQRAHELGAVTIPDLLSFHFQERVPILRLMSVVVILVAMLMYVAAQLAAAGEAFTAGFDDVKPWMGVLLGGVIVLAYTVIGGFRAACWTDFVQALLMLMALVGTPILLLSEIGGTSVAREALVAADPQLVSMLPSETGAALIGFLLGSSALGVNFGYPGQPHVLVRFMAMKDGRDARQAGVISIVWIVLTYLGAISTGLLVRALAEGGTDWASGLLNPQEGDSEVALVVAAMNLLPGVLSGFVLAAILAAVASTADSQLVVAASAVANDVYARLFDARKRRAHTLINRVVVFTLGVGAVLLVLDENINVYNYVLTYGWAMLGAAFAPQIALMLLWRRASYLGSIAGMLTGFVMVLAWPSINAWMITEELISFTMYNLTVAFIASLTANVLVSLLTPLPPRSPVVSEI